MLAPIALFSALAIAPVEREDHRLYQECGLEGRVNEQAFIAAVNAARSHGGARVIAIADMTMDNKEKRFCVVDLAEHRLLLHTWVAHGKGSGEDRCERVSDKVGSLCTCAGLMRVGERIISPRHGDAIMLRGLEPGLNANAEAREIIIHGADYVSAVHIQRHGRLGRSWGCPAVPREVMPALLRLLPEGSFLYVYAH